LSAGFLLAGTRDGGDSSNTTQKPSTTNIMSTQSSSPIYIKVQVNSKQQHAIIDTGSAVTIINQQLLKKIYHKKFIYRKKSHKSANCTSINIVGEIELEIKIQGHKTLILADVATNLVTDLLLGNDWITENNVIIHSPQQRIFLTDKHNRIISTTPFITPPDVQLPILLIDEITLPPYSEKYVDVTVPSRMNNITEALFEPASNLYSKQILLTNALIRIDNNKSRLMIINANNRQRTLSKNTKLGYISCQSESNNYFILPVLANMGTGRPTHQKSSTNNRNDLTESCSCAPLPQQKRKVRFTDFTCQSNRDDDQLHQCYVCQEHLLTRNNLQEHLRQKCYPQDMREKIEKLTSHMDNLNQKQQLQHILWKYGKLFDLRKPSIIKATVHHAMETGAHPPSYTPPYRVSYKNAQTQHEEIDKLLKQGVIEESISPWSSPIVLVRKKDGSVRFCVDFRKLNNITTKDAFPIPRIDDIFDHLSQAEYYTTIDFKSGYFQVGLDPKDRPKTAFSTRDQHYQFTVLPQGVTNGPPAFQRIVSQILGATRWQYSLAYLDDVIIYSPSFEQHLIHLDDILNRLNDANFRLNVEKCQIARTSINYLGHHIEHSNIRPNADNIRALLEAPQPTTTKEAFRFVKAAEYYRKFIPKFSMIAEPLYKYAPITKEQRSKKLQPTLITLSGEELNAFNELKRILTKDLVLRIPDTQLPFKIQTDASKIGIGAVLMQTHPNGDLPVAYSSKKFTATQMNWPATEQECYAIIHAIEKWNKYLDGREFVIETDHKPLLPFNTKKQLNSKCERWRLKLQQYKFTIRYIKGKHNTVADYLSRSPVDCASQDEDDYIPIKSQSTQTENLMITAITASVVTRAQAKQQQHDKRNDDHVIDQSCNEQKPKRNVDSSIDRSCGLEDQQQRQPSNVTDDRIIPFTYEQLKELQHQDEETRHMIMHSDNFNGYFVEDDMLMKKSSPPVPFVPKGRIRSDIIKIYHDTPANGAHFGRNRTIQKIRQRYFWPSMIQDIRNYVKSCVPCLQNNHLRQKPPGALEPIKPPEGVWQLLTMDFHGPIIPTSKNGNKYIISLTDVLSKFVITKAVRDCTATTATHFLIKEVILKYGTPKCILTDNGTHFTASMMTELFKKIGVTHLYSTPYHPMTNGQIERYNATMDSKIATLSNENRTNWDEQLPYVTFNYNTSAHTTTGIIPFELMHGRSPVLPFDQQQPIVTLSQDPEHVNKLKQYLSSLTEHAKTNILQQQKKYKERYDRYRTNPVYKINDLVLIQTLNRRNKFDIRYEGPYRIVQKIGPKTYIVKHIKNPILTRQVTTDVIRPLYERRNI
jgi:transposase InsO family protein